jgi:hypothetical protein
MAFSTRKVATEAGSKFFGLPIGAPITESDQKHSEGRNKPVTKLRLQSLQRQFIAAKRTKNQPLMSAVNQQFKQELAIYMDVTGESAHAILDDLDANPDKGFHEETEIKDTDTADENKVEKSEKDS